MTKLELELPGDQVLPRALPQCDDDIITQEEKKNNLTLQNQLVTIRPKGQGLRRSLPHLYLPPQGTRCFREVRVFFHLKSFRCCFWHWADANWALANSEFLSKMHIAKVICKALFKVGFKVKEKKSRKNITCLAKATFHYYFELSTVLHSEEIRGYMLNLKSLNGVPSFRPWV